MNTIVNTWFEMSMTLRSVLFGLMLGRSIAMMIQFSSIKNNTTLSNHGCATRSHAAILVLKGNSRESGLLKIMWGFYLLP